MEVAFCSALGSGHSVAVAARFQLIALLEANAGLQIERHQIADRFPHTANDLLETHISLINELRSTSSKKLYDVVFHYGEPSFNHLSKLTLDFFVTEYGGNIPEYQPYQQVDNHLTMVPSNWVKALLVERGHLEKNIAVVPHGIDIRYFYPMPYDLIDLHRKQNNIDNEAFVILNVGALTANKGLIYLLEQFGILSSLYPNMVLILKDSSHLYGISAAQVVRQAVQDSVLPVDSVSKIRFISGSLTFAMLRLLYNMSDCYVSPYVAEGFNLPALESIACGTPVIATARGPTDDFLNDQVASIISSSSIGLYQGVSGRFLMPSKEHLNSLIRDEFLNRRKRDPIFAQSASCVTSKFDYRSITLNLLKMLGFDR